MRRNQFTLNLTTELSADALTQKLAQYEPWGHRIDFNNGVSTADLAHRTPFNIYTIQKIKAVENSIPFQNFRNGTVLDIGCNSGHNSIYLAMEYGMKPTGIDISPRHIDVSRLLSEIANIDSHYTLGDAETFCNEGSYDVVLHFGTLYHLPNPLLSLQTSYKNLKQGGYLALETQVYDHPKDKNICYFMHMHNNDKTNFWALSTHVLKQYLEILGFKDIKEILKVSPKMLEKNMSRIILVAVK
ncbi:MAG: methyltransferase domain-containing protein [Gammaproteobacteria bacterium]|nr:methyltransferase domain-containing protein [Gammaproteobacteria bacterium]